MAQNTLIRKSRLKDTTKSNRPIPGAICYGDWPQNFLIMFPKSFEAKGKAMNKQKIWEIQDLSERVGPSCCMIHLYQLLHDHGCSSCLVNSLCTSTPSDFRWSECIPPSPDINERWTRENDQNKAQPMSNGTGMVLVIRPNQDENKNFKSRRFQECDDEAYKACPACRPILSMRL